MATVYEFPVKVKLPKEVEEQLYGIAWDYVDALYSAIDSVYEDGMSEYEMGEVSKLVNETFTNGVADAIENLDDES